jgi:hypothetical protein
MHLGPGWADASPQDLTPASGRQDHTTSPSATISRQRSCRASCRPASSGEDGWQHRSSARRPIAHGKTRPAISLRARRCRVHRIPPRVRDDSRSAPHPGGTGRACRDDLPDGLSEIFLREGLDGLLLICPPGYFPSSFERQPSAAGLLCVRCKRARSASDAYHNRATLFAPPAALIADLGTSVSLLLFVHERKSRQVLRSIGARVFTWSFFGCPTALARRADHDPPLGIDKMAGYAFGSNPPYGLFADLGTSVSLLLFVQ